MDELAFTTRSLGADVVAVTEAWQITPETNTITNYSLFIAELKVHVPEGIEAL